MTSLNFEDFYKVPEIKFDISKLRKDLDVILEDSSLKELILNGKSSSKLSSRSLIFSLIS